MTKRLNGREMKALFFLSILVPVGLLTTFRLTGILPEPTTETITLETIKWEFQRPNRTLAIDEVLRIPFIHNRLSATFNLVISQYIERTTVIGDDWVYIAIMMNSTVTNSDAFIEGVDAIFNMDNQSIIGWPVTRHLVYDAENLSLTGYNGGHDGMWAYVSLKGIAKPKSAYFSAGAYWILRTPNTHTHQLYVAYELKYCNGTAHKKIVQPFQLKLQGS